MSEVRIVIERPDAFTTIDCTPILETARWSSADGVGFSTCTVDVEGVQPNEIPHLSKLTVYYGDQIAWDGLVEDRGRKKIQDGWRVSLTAVGHHSVLQRTTALRWHCRKDWEWDIEWPGFTPGVASRVMFNLFSSTLASSAAIGGASYREVKITDQIEITSGQTRGDVIDSFGLRFNGASGAVVPAGAGVAAWVSVGDSLGSGLQDSSITRIRGKYSVVGSVWGATRMRADICLTAFPVGTISGWWGTPWTNGEVFSALGIGTVNTGTFVATAAETAFSLYRQDVFPSYAGSMHGADIAHVVVWNSSPSPISFGEGDAIEFTNLRFHHTPLDEDAPGVDPYSGGFYGGRLLADIIRNTPGLQIGKIAVASEFALDQFPNPANSSPQPVKSLVDEIRSYYDKRFGVWEDGRVDFLDRDTSVPEWTIRLDECLDHDLSDSVDGLYKDIYISGQYAGVPKSSFTIPVWGLGFDPATERVFPNPLNPFARTGRKSDLVVTVPFPITWKIATQLGYALQNYNNRYVRVHGRLVVPADLELKSGQGRRLAAFLRAGEDIVIADLPVEDLFGGSSHVLPDGSRVGGLSDRGMAVFTISGVETDLTSNTVTIEIDNAPRSADVIMARLAEITRSVTG